jgi:hypothetical protein
VSEDVSGCIFCGLGDRPMTREHVFAQWLIRKVHGARLIPSDVAIDASAGADERIARLTVRVCAVCNAGWMSSLEVSFRQLVFGRARAGALHAPDRTTLSRWFTKTAILVARARGGELLGATERLNLVTGMSDHVEVYLARRRRPSQHLDFAVDVRADAGGASMQVAAVSIQVGDLLGRVAARGTKATRHGTRIWPLRTHALRWETLPVVTPLIIRDAEPTAIATRVRSRR